MNVTQHMQDGVRVLDIETNEELVVRLNGQIMVVPPKTRTAPVQTFWNSDGTQNTVGTPDLSGANRGPGFVE
jgi:hypothetical protein